MSFSLPLSSCWSCHISSSFWSIVRNNTFVFESSAALWKQWNQKWLSHSLIQWVSMSLIGLSGTAKTDISSWSCGNAVTKMGNQFARSEYLKLSRGSNFKPNRWIYELQRISWMAVYFPELCVCWIIENYDFSNYNAVLLSQANDGIGHSSSNFQ